MRLLFVINPSSGSGQTNWQQLISNRLAGKEHTFGFFNMQKQVDNCEQVQLQINRYKPDRVIAVGGDGTIKMVAEILTGQKIPMAIIPAGSANGMAKELGIPVNYEKALELAIEGRPAALDMIRINDEYCIHLSDIGLNAKMLHYFEKSGQRGMWGYLKAVLKSWGRHFFMRVTIQADTTVIKCKALMVVIANAAQYGTGAAINPRGKTDDGVFEVVIVRRLPFLAIVNMLVLRRPFDPANIEILSCRSLQLSATRAYPFQVDGEYRGRQNQIRASIVPGAVEVVMGEEK